MRKEQISFTDDVGEAKKDIFGGSRLGISNPKVGRPIDAKLPLYVVLRAKKSTMRQPKIAGRVDETVREVAKKHGVKCQDYANVGNQLHMIIKLPHSRAWRSFIRELTGKIAQEVKGFEKLPDSFWKFRPYTRIIRNSQDVLKDVKDFIHLNSLEAQGSIKATEAKRLKDLKAHWEP